MRVVIFQVSGATGRHLVARAVAGGHGVAALARSEATPRRRDATLSRACATSWVPWRTMVFPGWRTSTLGLADGRRQLSVLGPVRGRAAADAQRRTGSRRSSARASRTPASSSHGPAAMWKSGAPGSRPRARTQELATPTHFFAAAEESDLEGLEEL
jgi:hypothetical protein